MIKDAAKFFYLNIDNHWPQFALTDLEITSDGVLQLQAVPRLTGRLPEGLSDLPIPQAPAGIARTEDGALFFTDPEKHQLWRIDPCDPEKKARLVTCLGSEGNDATQFRLPRGLLSVPGRGLLVADSGNHRLQLIDPFTLRVREIWNGIATNGTPQLNAPWAIALDSRNNIYVVVAGDHSLQKIDYWGRIDPHFQQTFDETYACSQASPPIHADPTAVAIATIDGEESVLVLDRNRRALIVFDLSGQWQQTFELKVAQESLQEPLTLAVSERAIFVGDNGQQFRTVLQFELPTRRSNQLRFIGAAVDYHGPIAALSVDCPATKSNECCEHAGHTISETRQCDLLVSAGNGVAPVMLKESLGYHTTGFAIAGPYDYRHRPVIWHRLQALTEELASRAHVQLFFKFSELPTGLAHHSPGVIANGSPPSDMFHGWYAFPPDVTEGIFESFAAGRGPTVNFSSKALSRPGHNPAASTYLWLGVKFSSDGTATPRIRQIRVEFDYASYLPYLPAVYSEDKASRQFLLPLLSLFESFFAEQESAISDLPALFDPQAVPAEALAWLAGWLAQDIEEGWSEQRKRQIIAEAFASYARSGTPGGLRRRLQLYAGTEAHVVEPLMNASLWSLGQTSTLNFDTMLAPTEAQGAVLGTTATLDHSHLITDAEFGAPLFEDIAHQFAIFVYPNAVRSPRQLEKLRAIIERDKPAHTDYQLCVIQPTMRVGFQATIGIDTVVGGQALPTPLSAQATSGLVLAGTPTPGLGEGSQVGINTQLY